MTNVQFSRLSGLLILFGAFFFGSACVAHQSLFDGVENFSGPQMGLQLKHAEGNHFQNFSVVNLCLVGLVIVSNESVCRQGILVVFHQEQGVGQQKGLRFDRIVSIRDIVTASNTPRRGLSVHIADFLVLLLLWFSPKGFYQISHSFLAFADNEVQIGNPPLQRRQECRVYDRLKITSQQSLVAVAQKGSPLSLASPGIGRFLLG
mmetsp:Transcript_21474/g.53257  ORF Transcript_21474/g.53257 Transcript_21474/m.53257 type:complete len:205 (+) Transcript_21474:216-830(+)